MKREIVEERFKQFLKERGYKLETPIQILLRSTHNIEDYQSEKLEEYDYALEVRVYDRNNSPKTINLNFIREEEKFIYDEKAHYTMWVSNEHKIEEELLFGLLYELDEDFNIVGDGKKELKTLHTNIVRGEIAFNSPTEYYIKHTITNETINIISFQKGPVKEEGLNGIFIEDLLLIIKDQLEHFQNSNFACEENQDTLRHINDALHSTRSRQYERSLRNVQGKNKI